MLTIKLYLWLLAAVLLGAAIGSMIKSGFAGSYTLCVVAAVLTIVASGLRSKNYGLTVFQKVLMVVSTCSSAVLSFLAIFIESDASLLMLAGAAGTFAVSLVIENLCNVNVNDRSRPA